MKFYDCFIDSACVHDFSTPSEWIMTNLHIGTTFEILGMIRFWRSMLGHTAFHTHIPLFC